jgi:hypothetical protein
MCYHGIQIVGIGKAGNPQTTPVHDMTLSPDSPTTINYRTGNTISL